MVKSIEDLKKERDALLRKDVARTSLLKLSRSRDLERKKLQSEINALRNPRSLSAKKSLKAATGRVGKFLVKRAKIVNENLKAAALEEERSRRVRGNTGRKVKVVRRRKR